jgi:hypothetical protein
VSRTYRPRHWRSGYNLVVGRAWQGSLGPERTFRDSSEPELLKGKCNRPAFHAEPIQALQHHRRFAAFADRVDRQWPSHAAKSVRKSEQNRLADSRRLLLELERLNRF